MTEGLLKSRWFFIQDLFLERQVGHQLLQPDVLNLKLLQGSVYRQFRRWTLAGLWELILGALNESGAVPGHVQMIDSTIIRAHHQAAGAKGGLKKKVLAAQKVALRPRFI